MARRRNGEGFIREKPGRRGLWEIRISIAQDDGTRIQKSFYEKSYESAEQRLQELRRANKQGRLKASKSPNLGGWISLWLSEILPHSELKPSTIQNYKDMVIGHCFYLTYTSLMHL